MAGAIVCVYFRQPWVAGVFLSVPVMSVVRSLIESAAARTPTAIVATPTQDTPDERAK
jgi:hypothetical protein